MVRAWSEVPNARIRDESALIFILCDLFIVSIILLFQMVRLRVSKTIKSKFSVGNTMKSKFPVGKTMKSKFLVGKTMKSK